MKKLITKSLFGILMAVIAVSCNPSVQISTTHDKNANVAELRTFGITVLTPKGDVIPENLKHIENAVKAELVKKGFTESNTKPDMVVYVKTVMKNKQVVSTKTSYSNTGESLQTSIYWSQYGTAAGVTTVEDTELKNGSLVVEVFDVVSKRRVWQGTVNAEISKKAPKDPAKLINSTVAKMMADFPAGNSTTEQKGIVTKK